jgi:hypothetical protein
MNGVACSTWLTMLNKISHSFCAKFLDRIPAYGIIGAIDFLVLLPPRTFRDPSLEDCPFNSAQVEALKLALNC